MKTKYLILITLIGLIYSGCSKDEADIFQRLAAQMTSDNAKTNSSIEEINPDTNIL